MEIYKNENIDPMDFNDMDLYENYFDDSDFDDLDLDELDYSYMNSNDYYPIGISCEFCPFAQMHGMRQLPGGQRQMNMPPFPGMSNTPNMQGPPTAPPPSFTPNKSTAKSGGISTKAVDTGSIRPCLYRFTYIWQSNGRSYWTYLTYVGKKSISGWRWMRFRWVYFGLDLRKIDSFYCV
ncbi:hypothetical protein [Haloimpatiens massiliensis]|uniref:hypothetical protein n=1 Tax=Haloimpatiens massiliensis TaxID=1658110 RepID=UPI001FA87500|nr:hypothetical protein [Haloimpatiens massiliensis]